ncbi:set domain-containing protein [Moniliophthora roreri MCA 2997]|uniref:Set domain-containing protein n=1 Tax=Moniliophthora roreri (strain MCA 2997) TaxID=1381753 RepID=V2WWZ0_MONRO|nr:set domain-containing protein [Moniliophthora roreri MCA 2997]
MPSAIAPCSRLNSRTSHRRRSSAGLALPLQQITSNVVPAQHSLTRKTPHRVTFNAIQDVCAIPEKSSDRQLNYIKFKDGVYCTDLPAPSVRTGIPKPSTYYQIAPVGGPAHTQGLGMLATNDIARGSVILVERPVLVILASALNYLTLEMLDPKLAKVLLGLSSSDDTLEGIIRTNSKEIEVPVQGSEMKRCFGLFPDMARVNHSCGPNALWRWDSLNLMLTLEAVRPIAAGSEITIPYIDCLQPRSSRRHQLKSIYGFECHCDFCDIHWGSLPTGVHSSDSTRMELAEFWDRLPPFEEWCSDTTAEDEELIKMHIRALELREQEGTQGFCYKKHIEAIAMCYGSLADVEGFRVWTERARRLRISGGEFAAPAVLEKWLDDPREFPVWGMRAEVVTA